MAYVVTLTNDESIIYKILSIEISRHKFLSHVTIFFYTSLEGNKHIYKFT